MEFPFTGFVHTHVNDDVHPIFKISIPANTAVGKMVSEWQNNTTHSDPSLTRFPYRLIEIVHVLMTLTRYHFNFGPAPHNPVREFLLYLV